MDAEPGARWAESRSWRRRLRGMSLHAGTFELPMVWAQASSRSNTGAEPVRKSASKNPG